MTGKPTEIVVSQHVLIYSWLMYQYQRQVDTRFILHDTEAKEVANFYTYYHSMVAGGTQVATAYKLVNDIVESENLARDYNIYVFHGTDGDDWDKNGEETIPEIQKMLGYCSRIGITIANGTADEKYRTFFEKYMVDSDLLEKFPKLIRMDTVVQDAGEEQIIEGIRSLIS